MSPKAIDGPLHRFFRGFLGLGIALAALTIAAGAHAEDWDWKSKDDSKEEKAKIKDTDKKVRVYRWRQGETADKRGGYMGVQVQDMTRTLARARDLETDSGALVNRVEEESPAEEAGIRRGDVIVSVDGKEIEDSGELIEVVRSLKPEDEVKVVVVRGDERRTFTVTMGNRPRDQVMILPRGPRMRDFEGAWNVPAPPRMELHRERVDDLRETIRELDEQIRAIRETALPRLEEQLRAMREELRAMEDSREEGRPQIRREGRRSRTPADDEE